MNFNGIFKNKKIIFWEKKKFKTTRNIVVFKKRLKAIVEQQLEVVNDIEKIDF